MDQDNQELRSLLEQCLETMDQDNQELRSLFEQWKTSTKNADLPTWGRFPIWFNSTKEHVNFTTGDIDTLVREKKKEVKAWAKGVYAKLADLKKKLEEVNEIFMEEMKAANGRMLDPPGTSPAGLAPSATPFHLVRGLVIFIGVVSPTLVCLK